MYFGKNLFHIFWLKKNKVFIDLRKNTPEVFKNLKQNFYISFAEEANIFTSKNKDKVEKTVFKIKSLVF